MKNDLFNLGILQLGKSVYLDGQQSLQMGPHVQLLSKGPFYIPGSFIVFVLCMLDELIQINILICIIVHYCE